MFKIWRGKQEKKEMKKRRSKEESHAEMRQMKGGKEEMRGLSGKERKGTQLQMGEKMRMMRRGEGRQRKGGGEEFEG